MNIESEIVLCNIKEINKTELFKAIKMLPAVYEENTTRYKREIDQVRHLIGIMLMISMCPEKSHTYTIKRGAYGKPYVVEFPDYYYNISHSGDYVVCATSPSKVGVDIQIKEYLTPAGWELFMNTHEIEKCRKNNIAGMIWSAKEAITKYVGCGLSDQIKEIDLSEIYNANFYPDDKDSFNSLHLNGSLLYLFQKQVAHDYYLSYCSDTCCMPKIKENIFNSYLFT